MRKWINRREKNSKTISQLNPWRDEVIISVLSALNAKSKIHSKIIWHISKTQLTNPKTDLSNHKHISAYK